MRIYGIEKLTAAELEAALAAGGRFVLFEYCISLVLMTLRRSSGVYFMRPCESGLLRGVPYTVLSLLLGWWGVPWGLVYTPLVVLMNLSGGRDVTAEVRAQLLRAANCPPS
jgi:hypothetical protein